MEANAFELLDVKKCALFLTQVKKKTETYVREVKESPNYSRLLIRQKKQAIEPKIKKNDYSGFLPKTNPKADNFLFYVVPNPQILPRWISKKVLKESRDLKVSDGIKTVSNKILDKVSQTDTYKNSDYLKYFSNPELTGLASFFVDVLVATGTIGLLESFVFPPIRSVSKSAYTAFDIWTDPAWDNSVQYDYRYFYIKQKLVRHQISNFESHKEAHLLNLAYKDYYQYMLSQYSKDNFFDMKNHLRIISDKIKPELPALDRDIALFSTVFWFIDNGVQTTPLYVAIKPGPLAHEQEIDLFNIYNSLYLNYQSVSKWVQSGQTKTNRALNMILNQSHTKKLISFFNSGKLSSLQLMYFMGQDLYFETYFQELEILQIKPFKSHDNEITFITTTLEDIQNRVDQNIENQVGMP